METPNVYLKELVQSMEGFLESLENKEIGALVARGKEMESHYLNTLKPIELTKQLLKHSLEEEMLKASQFN